MSENQEKKKNGFSTAGLVLSIIGVCTSFIPIVNNLSFVLGIIAIIFAIVALIQKAGKGKIIVTIILAILTIAITLSVQKSASDALNKVSADLNKATGNSTDDVLKNDVDVTLGEFKATSGEYGTSTTELPVTVKNKTSETKSFSIQVEAVDSNGSRIDTDYVYANNLAAGQSQDFKIFTLISSDKLESVKNATFKIVEASVN